MVQVRAAQVQSYDAATGELRSVREFKNVDVALTTLRDGLQAAAQSEQVQGLPAADLRAAAMQIPGAREAVARCIETGDADGCDIELCATSLTRYVLRVCR